MRWVLVVCLLCCCGCSDAFFWLMRSVPMRTNRKETHFEEDVVYDNEYQTRIAGTGRVLVTMMGYPQRCERSGQQHVCTLALSCWMAGGSSQAGCGTNTWVVTCCIIAQKPPPQPQTQLLHPQYSHKYQGQEQGQGQGHEQGINEVYYEETKVLPLSPPQKRMEEECGLSADRVISKRIIGGDEARFAQFPWQAHLKILSYQCGGVLVSRKYVATAAHCILRAKLNDITVYLGELDTQDTGKVIELAPAELHRVNRKILHPNFEFRTTQPDRYDLALLHMVTPAGHSFHIAPICLPHPGLQLQGREAVVAGWGKIQPSNSLSGTNVLRSARVPILSKEKCYTWHTSKQIKVELFDDMLCAGHEDGKHDACMGDSGGPLIVLENGRWTLAGITSAGFGCGEYHQPGIYHSVAVTSNWIRKIISREFT